MNKTFPLLVIASVTCLTVAASAAPITVPNFSFENPSAPGNPGYTNGNTTGINPDVMANWLYTSGGASNSYGVQITSTAQFNLGQVTDSQFGYINSNNTPASITSGILTTVAASTDYTFTIGLGKRLDAPTFTDEGQFTLNILLNGSSVASTVVNGTSLTAGNIADYSVTFSSGILSSGDLTTQLSFNHVVNAGPGNVSQGPFDNARFDATTTVPEPSTVTLLGGAFTVFGMLCRRARKNSRPGPVGLLPS